MRARIFRTIGCLLLLVVSHYTLGQNRDTAFMRLHSLNRPDSVLVKDTLLFPSDTIYSRYCYTSTSTNSRWADSGYSAFVSDCGSDSVFLLLRGDHAFIFQAKHGLARTQSIGHWWSVKDSLICLNWDDRLSILMAKRPKFDYPHKTFSDVIVYLPIRIDHWWFVRRGSQLVPY
jgi:hypothetical protein